MAGQLTETGVNYVIAAQDVSQSAINAAIKGTTRLSSATDRMAAKTKKTLAAYRSHWIAAASAIATAVPAYAVKKYGEFEKELANVSTLVDTSRISMEGMKREILALSPALGSATENTKGLYQALSAGVEPAKAVAFLGEAAMAAKAGLSDTFTAVDAGTTIMNAFGIEVEKANDVYDLMFTTVKEGKTTFEALAAAEAKISPIAAAANVTIEEQHAALATLTKGGFKTAEASARLATALGAIIKPSADAEKTAEALNLKFNAQALAAKGLHGFLNDVKAATGGNVEMMAKLFGGMESLSVILALTGKQSEEFTDILVRMKDRSGAVKEAFDKQKWSLSAMWETFKSVIEKQAIMFGEDLAPALKDVLEKTTAWIEANRELIAQKTQDAIAGISSAITTIVDLYRRLPDGIAGAAGVGLVGWILFGPYGAAIAGTVSLLASSLKTLSKEMDSINQNVTDFNVLGDPMGAYTFEDDAALRAEEKLLARNAKYYQYNEELLASTAAMEDMLLELYNASLERESEAEAESVQRRIGNRISMWEEASASTAAIEDMLLEQYNAALERESRAEAASVQRRIDNRISMWEEASASAAAMEDMLLEQYNAARAAEEAEERERLLQSKQRMLSKYNAQLATALIEIRLEKDKNRQLKKINDEKERLDAQSAQTRYNIAVSLGQAMLAFAGVNSEAIFLIMKAFAVVQAIVAAHQAAALALANPPGPPWTAPLAKSVLAWGYANAAAIAAQAVATYAFSGSAGTSDLGSAIDVSSDLSSSVTDTDIATVTETGDESEEEKRSLSVNVHIYGNVVDHDQFAREMVTAIRKAEADGV